MNALPPGPFSIVYADPCWKYARAEVNGACEPVYQGTMTFEEIAALPVSDICAPDAMLFMWVTWPKLWEGAEDNPFRIMERWGFRYVTCGLLWVKINPLDKRPRFGQGWYTKSNSEACLLGVRGHPIKRTNSISQILEAPHEIYAPVTRHSEKPDEARRKIVEFCGDLPRIEMFARHSRHGFVPWGNEVPIHDELELPGLEAVS